MDDAEKEKIRAAFAYMGPQTQAGLTLEALAKGAGILIQDLKAGNAAQADRLREALLQLSEVIAHRDRLRDMLNEIRGRAYRDVFSSEPSNFAALALKIVEDGHTEKGKDVSLADERACATCGGAGLRDVGHAPCHPVVEKRKDAIVEPSEHAGISCSICKSPAPPFDPCPKCGSPGIQK